MSQFNCGYVESEQLEIIGFHSKDRAHGVQHFTAPCHCWNDGKLTPGVRPPDLGGAYWM